MYARKRVVIIGGGFGGIQLAKSLKNSEFDVLLIDKNNFHTFQPLLYQVATSGLEPGSIAYPIRRVFRKISNVKFRMAEVKNILTDQSKIETSVGLIHYDYLVIATGSSTNYFNFDSKKGKLLSLKSVVEALDIRSFIMENLEKAMLTRSITEQQELINVAIVGGGPAGIEMAGALAEMKKWVLPKDYPDIDFTQMQIHLFEASDRLLGAMSPLASKAAKKHLEKLDVVVELNTMVEDYDGARLKIKGKEDFISETVIWTAGVKGNIPHGLSEEIVAPGNRIKVDDFNKVLGYDNVYAIGDVSANINDETPRGLPMLAPVSMQQGLHLAKNLMAIQKGKNPKKFEYKDKGSMATIGRKKAVVDLPSISFQGTFAWFVWMLIHLLSLVGFRNKLVTLVDWIQNYFNYDRPLGLIIRRYKRKD
ncbi:NADH dehydrogenase [Lishizhenia tianjinensis]|uniref:NADH:ubiquinone reductase (non-electrogenic) n=1 Tax=Lishizhenia tianjinensis TaxID=477690 RepID=A0A1I6Y1C3_9FLAO|nr:NAD(P)/FAD-dependent oxidoreductase [Lishizhenia tianjinensis]SFT44112.1 NADH dehydrogenase [Lishizhenia tianjinensis]